MRKNRILRKDAGVCLKCPFPVEVGVTSCRACRVAVMEQCRTTYAEKRSQGLCRCKAPAIEGQSRCVPCAEMNKIKAKARRAAKKVKCRRKSCPNEVKLGCTSCAPCLEIHASYAIKAKLAAGSDECECSRPKGRLAVSCDSCAEMDGQGSVANLVSALRVLGGEATFAALQQELGYAETNIYRAIRMAKAAGRLVQVQRWDHVPNLQNRKTVLAEKRNRSSLHRQMSASQAGTQHDCPPLFVLIDKVRRAA